MCVLMLDCREATLLVSGLGDGCHLLVTGVTFWWQAPVFAQVQQQYPRSCLEWCVRVGAWLQGRDFVWFWMYLDLEADDTFGDTAGIRVFGPVSGKTGRASGWGRSHLAYSEGDSRSRWGCTQISDVLDCLSAPVWHHHHRSCISCHQYLVEVAGLPQYVDRWTREYRTVTKWRSHPTRLRIKRSQGWRWLSTHCTIPLTCLGWSGWLPRFVTRWIREYRTVTKWRSHPTRLRIKRSQGWRWLSTHCTIPLSCSCWC